MDAHVSLKDKLELLTPEQRAIMRLIARDYRYQEIANELKLEAPAIYDSVIQLFSLFDLPIKEWDDSYDELARIGRENGFATRAPGADSPSAPKPDTAKPQESAIDSESDANSSDTQPPDLDAVVERICKLNPKDGALLRAAMAGKRGAGNREELARIAGVNLPSLAARLGTLYVRTLGVSVFPGRKKFLQQALALAEKRLRLQKAAEPAQPTLQPEAQPVPTVLAQPLPPAPEEHADGYVSSGALSTAGHSAVIAIPATVEDADVVAGQFDGTHPAHGLEEQIQKRKKGGYKPSFLVLTTTNDPRVTQAQMVFLKHASE